MDLLPISLDDQVAAVQASRDYLARSLTWRAGRRNFDKSRHARELAALDAAIATLMREKSNRDAIMAFLMGPNHG